MEKTINNLRAIVGRENVLSQPDELLVYECDGLPQHKYRPAAVVFPSTTEETSAVMRELARANVPFTPRGAGTGLSGGALALNQGVVIELARLRKLLKIDEENRVVVVQTGVVNSHVSRAAAHLNLHYVPDPSSQPTCTIGGNVAENAGGIHCLKYGTTTDHVLALRVVLAGGEVVDLQSSDAAGYDLLGLFVGSEGTFGIATEATLRLVPIPPAVRTLLAEFEDVNDASHAVSAIIAAGVIPAALEMMDHEIIRAVEASVFAAGLSQDIGAALLIELDGIEAGIDDEVERIKSICLSYKARTCRAAENEAERQRLWAARKSAFGAVSRISPDSMIQDAVVPRSRLPEILADAYRISAKYELRLANVFHAGDGNLHPLICFDSRFEEQRRRVKEAGRELMETCVRAGGSITGEHGVGYDKRELLSLIFSEPDLNAMLSVRAAFDPTGLCNPGKIIPMLRGCGEGRSVAIKTEAETPAATHLPVGGSRRIPAIDSSKTLERLVSIAGERNVSGTTSPLEVTPETIEKTCEVINLAAGAGWKVLPAGSGTWLNAGNNIEHVDVVLSTGKLNRIVEHEPADLVAVAQAGVTLRAFNQHLSQRGQWLALDPPDDGNATIGGVVATGLGGLQQFGYGAPRRHVIGMKVVTADGQLIKMGGRVVKNVAGYDLSKLFTGSYGTLGVIVEVNFRLRPLPQKTATVIATGSVYELFDLSRQVLAARLFPVAIQLLSRAAAERAGIEVRDCALLIRFAGSGTAVTEQARATTHLAASAVETFTEDATLWPTLARLPLSSEEGVSFRIKMRPTDVMRFVQMLPSSEEATWCADVAEGLIRVFVNSTEQATRLVPLLRKEAEANGGRLIIENAPPEFKNTFEVWGNAGDGAAISQRIKQQIDPRGMFSPGRFGRR